MKTNLVLESQVPLDETHNHIFWGKGAEVNYLEPGDRFIIKPLRIIRNGKPISRKKLQYKYVMEVNGPVVKMYEPKNTDPRTLDYYKSLPQEAKDKYEWTLKHSVSLQQGKPVPCRWHIPVKCVSVINIKTNLYW